MTKRPHSTSWEPVEEWYDRTVGEKGSYYHQHLILPALARLLDIANKAPASLVEFGCGQGVVARSLPPHWSYLGIDLSPSLIASARKQTKRPHTTFQVGDASLPLSIGTFTHALFLLSLQNMERSDLALQTAARHLTPGGKLLLVLNHPCFRIPRQSSWEVDERNKILYRRLNRYATPLKVPIQAHPGSGGDSPQTVSFHFSLQDLFKWLTQAGFAITGLEEWVSPKKSEGGRARMEDRARCEFPLFLAIVAEKAASNTHPQK